MKVIGRRRQHPGPRRAPTNVDIERMLQWAAAELRAERRFPWYVSRCPSRFIGCCSPSEN